MTANLQNLMVSVESYIVSFRHWPSKFWNKLKVQIKQVVNKVSRKISKLILDRIERYYKNRKIYLLLFILVIGFMEETIPNVNISETTQVNINNKGKAKIYYTLPLGNSNSNRNSTTDIPNDNILIYGVSGTVSSTFSGISNSVSLAVAWPLVELRPTKNIDNKGNSYYEVDFKDL